MLKPLEISNLEEKVDYSTIFKSTFINVDEKIEKEPVCISFGTKFNEYAPIVTYGNFMCIVGPSKSMKTFLKSALLAGYIGGNSQKYFEDLRGHETEGKLILDFDTEQSKRHAQRASRRVVNMVGARSEFYKPFFLRELSPRERVQYIDYLLNDYYSNQPIGLISIDGIADLVENVNDLDKSNEIVQKLMKITTDKNCGLITVIHKNYESDKPTGHLGSAVLKKSESVLFVNKNNDLVTVDPKYSRNIPIDGFEFTVNDEGIPEQAGGTSIFN